MITDLTVGAPFKIDWIDQSEEVAEADAPLLNDALSRALQRNGVWEQTETEACLLLLRTIAEPDDLFVDVGAHVGYYTLMHAAHGLRCIAFEPNRFYMERLKSGIEASGLTRRVHAVANRVGARVSSRTTILDREVKPDAGVFMVKLDCVGNEPQVIAGATELLARQQAKAFLIEISLQYEGRKEGSGHLDYATMCEAVATAGYRCFDLGERRNQALSKVGNPLFHRGVRPLPSLSAAEFLLEFRGMSRSTFLFLSEAVIERGLVPTAT
jgi:hypothetical protein